VKRPSCSPTTKGGGLPSTSPSCRSCCSASPRLDNRSLTGGWHSRKEGNGRPQRLFYAQRARNS
jgi:hypothetical protein